MDFLTIPCVDSDGTWRRGALTARLKFTLADGDSDGIPDWWENLYAGAGLSPTNSADVWLDLVVALTTECTEARVRGAPKAARK